MIEYRASSFCSLGNCVEVGFAPGDVLVRDTKRPEGSTELAFTREEWAAFVAGVKAGEFDLPAQP